MVNGFGRGTAALHKLERGIFQGSNLDNLSSGRLTSGKYHSFPLSAADSGIFLHARVFILPAKPATTTTIYCIHIYNERDTVTRTVGCNPLGDNDCYVLVDLLSKTLAK